MRGLIGMKKLMLSDNVPHLNSGPNMQLLAMLLNAYQPANLQF